MFRFLLIYPVSILVLLFGILPVYKYYSAEEGKNDCMIQYVEQSKKYGIEKGFIYRLEDGSYHVEHIFSENVPFLEKMKIGEIKSCSNHSDDKVADILNKAYCEWVFILH